MNRRILLAGGAALAIAGAGAGALLWPTAPRVVAARIAPDDLTLGAADAPVEIIEYASLTCSHCAIFHAGTLRELIAKHVEPGRARLALRPFPLDALALKGAALAQALPREARWAFLDAAFAQQSAWLAAPDPEAALAAIAADQGMSTAAARAAMADTAVQEAALRARAVAHSAYGISGTPSLLVNGRLVEGAVPLRRIEQAIDSQNG